VRSGILKLDGPWADGVHGTSLSGIEQRPMPAMLNFRHLDAMGWGGLGALAAPAACVSLDLTSQQAGVNRVASGSVLQPITAIKVGA
jgi:hypothetical protein